MDDRRSGRTGVQRRAGKRGAAGTAEGSAGRRGPGDHHRIPQGTTGRPRGCELTRGSWSPRCAAQYPRSRRSLRSPAARLGCSHPLRMLSPAHPVGCLEAGAILGHWPDPATLVGASPGFTLGSCPRYHGYSRSTLTPPGSSPRPAPRAQRSSPLPPGQPSSGAERRPAPPPEAAQALRSGCGTPCSTASSTAGYERRPAAVCNLWRRDAGGCSATSSAAAASRFSKATG